MHLAEKAMALLDALRLEDIEALPPANRRRLAQVLRHIADIADPPPKAEAPAR